MEANNVVNLGIVGRLYSCLNVLGFYRCTALLAKCSYSTANLSDPDSWFVDRFDQALYQTVQYHPTLCYGIIDETPEREAHFLRLPAIYRDDVVEFCGQSTEDETRDDNAIVIDLFENWHTRRLLEGHRKPSWRVIVFKYGSQWGTNPTPTTPSTQCISISFLANHGIADGLSHTNFFRSLFHFFNDAKTERFSWPVPVPNDLRSPVLLEDVVDLQAKDESHNSQKNVLTNLWAGSNIFLNSIEDYQSRVRLVSIPPGPLSKALQLCKAHNITLTGLLNSLLVIYLARESPIGHSFRAIVPYSMRHITKIASDEMCNHASGMSSEYPTAVVAALHNSTENSSQELELIVNIAKDFRREMSAELVRCPKNNILAGMMGVKDLYGASKNQVGTKRAFTYGISNFGCVAIIDPAEHGEDAPLKLERMIVSQCGSVTGPVFGFNCLSIPGGALEITLTWQEGVVEQRFMDSMAKYLFKRMTVDIEMYLAMK